MGSQSATVSLITKYFGRIGQRGLQGGASSKITASTWKKVSAGERVDTCGVEVLRSKSNEANRGSRERK